MDEDKFVLSFLFFCLESIIPTPLNIPSSFLTTPFHNRQNCTINSTATLFTQRSNQTSSGQKIASPAISQRPDFSLSECHKSNFCCVSTALSSRALAVNRVFGLSGSGVWGQGKRGLGLEEVKLEGFNCILKALKRF